MAAAETPKPEKKEETVPLRLIYTGKDKSEKKGEIAGFLIADGDSEIVPGVSAKFWDHSSFKKHTHLAVGHVYEVQRVVTADPDAYTIQVSTIRYVEKFRDADRVARWSAEARAREAEMALEAKAKKAAAENPVLDCLEPIRAAYVNAVGLQRSLILAQAVAYITTGRRKS